jgi:hypothetical protein
MPVDNLVVAVFNTHRGVEDAFPAPRTAGYGAGLVEDEEAVVIL